MAEQNESCNLGEPEKGCPPCRNLPGCILIVEGDE